MVMVVGLVDEDIKAVIITVFHIITVFQKPEKRLNIWSINMKKQNK